MILKGHGLHQGRGKYPVVIKADGLALGKGVLICQSEQEATDGVKGDHAGQKFGASGNHVVVEEFLTGPEVSVLSFCDGKTVKPMVSSMDHKRALDHDEGLNTGGMGTVVEPLLHPEMADRCMKEIFLPTVAAMKAEGCPFKGLPLLRPDADAPTARRSSSTTAALATLRRRSCCPCWKAIWLTIMEATTNGTLDKTEVRFRDGAAACVILAEAAAIPSPMRRARRSPALTTAS